ncbi:MAG TPA: hypothetical protein VK081_00305 [Planctomycetota bacterium]|nr:hypothetical protein [Planctomycetota bacterium]
MTIVVDPDPAIEGQPATIKVNGPGPYYWRVSGRDWEEIPIDEERGTGTITLPAGSGGGVLDVSDLKMPSPDQSETLVNSND